MTLLKCSPSWVMWVLITMFSQQLKPLNNFEVFRVLYNGPSSLQLHSRLLTAHSCQAASTPMRPDWHTSKALPDRLFRTLKVDPISLIKERRMSMVAHAKGVSTLSPTQVQPLAYRVLHPPAASMEPCTSELDASPPWPSRLLSFLPCISTCCRQSQ